MCWGLGIQNEADSLCKMSFDLQHIGVITSGGRSFDIFSLVKVLIQQQMLLNMVIKLKSICFEVEAVVISRWSLYCFSFKFKQREHNLSLIYDKIQMIKLSQHI